MLFFKKKVSEHQVVATIIKVVIDDARDSFQPLMENLSYVSGQNFQVENEKYATYDLFLAMISLELMSLKNLFEEKQAYRIYNILIECIDTKDDNGKYAISEIHAYIKVFKEALNKLLNSEFENTPNDEMSMRLLYRLCDGDTALFVNTSNFIDPLVITVLNTYLTVGAGRFKRIKDSHKIIE